VGDPSIGLVFCSVYTKRNDHNLNRIAPMKDKIKNIISRELTNFLPSDYSDHVLIEEVVVVPVLGDDWSEIVVRPNQHVSDLSRFELSLEDYPQFDVVSVTVS